MNRIIRVAGLVSLLATAVPCGASAHAHLEYTRPFAGGRGQAAPMDVAIGFSKRLESHFSRIGGSDAQGQRADRGDSHTDLGDAKRLVVHPKTLPPGTYTVRWHAVSVETHRAAGTSRVITAR